MSADNSGANIDRGTAGSEDHSVNACPICQTAIDESDSTHDCEDCSTTHHEECWEDNSGCGMYGCICAPETLKWEDHEVPIGYWGQTSKKCPVCNHEIKVSAIRCKKCGTTFRDKTPEEAEKFHQKTIYCSQKDRLQKILFLILGCSVIPFTAPLALTFGGLWILAKRKAIGHLKPFYKTISMISLLVALLNILIIATFSYFIATFKIF